MNYITLFEGWLNIFTILIFAVYSLIFLKGGYIKRIVIPIIMFALILLVNLFIAFVFSIILDISSEKLMSSGDAIRLMTLFITKFLFYILSKIIVSAFKNDFFKLKKSEWILHIFMFIMTYSIAVIVAEIQLGYENSNILSISLILCIIAISIAIFYLFRKVSEKNDKDLQLSILKMQIDEHKRFIDNSVNIDKEIKKAEHDLKHHFICLLGTLENDHVDDAKQYIRNLINQYEIHVRKYVDVDSNAINSVINYKIEYCKVNNIDTKISIGADFSSFEEIDMCVLLSNLFDNAIEASLNMASPKIEIDISNNANYLCILMRNRIQESVLANNKLLKTTKKDKSLHGLGLYSVSQIVKKYDGIKSIYERKGFFTVDVWLKKEQYSIEERIKEIELDAVRQK